MLDNECLYTCSRLESMIDIVTGYEGDGFDDQDGVRVCIVKADVRGLVCGRGCVCDKYAVKGRCPGDFCGRSGELKLLEYR